MMCLLFLLVVSLWLLIGLVGCLDASPCAACPHRNTTVGVTENMPKISIQRSLVFSHQVLHTFDDADEGQVLTHEPDAC